MVFLFWGGDAGEARNSPKDTKEWTNGWWQLMQKLPWLLSSGFVVEQR